MSPLSGRLPLIALFSLLGVIALCYTFPEVIRSVAAIWNLLLFISIPATLAWFVYWIYVRRILRIRGIAMARMKRLMREAAERES